MRSTARFATLCAVLFLQGMAVRAQAPSIIEFPFEHHGWPCWISAEAVADAEKIVNFDLIRNDFLRGIAEKQLRALDGRLLVKELVEGRKPTIATIPLSENLKQEVERGPYEVGQLVCRSRHLTVNTVGSPSAFDPRDNG